METDVLPVAACLVTGPNACIALCTGPSVQADDEGAGVIAIVGHDLCHVRDAVQAKGIAGTHPSYVCLEYAYAGIAHFLYNVALEQWFHAFLGMQVRLGPQSYFYSIPVGIVCQVLQILDIAVQGTGLSIPCAIAVVGQKPSQRHVMRFVAVYYCTGRELIVLFLAVQRFLDATVVFLAFLVTFAVLEADARCILFPIVAVVGVQVSFIETELRQQDRMAGQLVIVVQQVNWAFVYQDEEVQIVCLVAQCYEALLFSAEVIFALGKGVPQDTISCRGPIEGIGRSHATVRPTVLVLDGDGLSFVRKASVLHAAAVEVLSWLFLQRQGDLFLVESCGSGFFQYNTACPEVCHAHQSCVLVKCYPYPVGFYR